MFNPGDSVQILPFQQNCPNAMGVVMSRCHNICCPPDPTSPVGECITYRVRYVCECSAGCCEFKFAELCEFELAPC